MRKASFIVLIAGLLTAVVAVTRGQQNANRDGEPQAQRAGQRESAPEDQRAKRAHRARERATKPSEAPSSKPSSESSHKPGEKPNGKHDSRSLPMFTPAREAAALAFVSEHHPELASLLEQLKSKNHRQYQKAVRDLFRQSERLAQIKERVPTRYELELALWKVNSRVQLLCARQRVKPDPALEAELKSLLLEQIDLELARYDEEQAKLEGRLEKLKRLTERLRENRAAEAERRLERIVSSSRRKPTPKKEPQTTTAVKKEDK